MTETINKLNGIEVDKIDADIISSERFKYPDMGDFYLNAVDDPYYKRLKEAMEAAGLNDDGTYDMDEIGKEGLTEDEINDMLVNGNSPQAMSFYFEEPPVTQLGDYPEKGVIFFKAKVDLTDSDREMGYFDADTIPYLVDTVDAGNPDATKKIIGAFEQAKRDLGIKGTSTNSVRLVGIDAPEVPHWSTAGLTKKEFQDTYEKLTYGEVKDYPSRYVVRRSTNRSDDEVIHFFREDKDENVYQEVLLPKGYSGMDKNDKIEVTYLSKSEETEPKKIYAGAMLQRKIQDVIRAAGNEIYVMADGTSLGYTSAVYPTRYGTAVDSYDKAPTLEWFKYMHTQIEDYNKYKYSGYSEWGQDKYGRWLGAVYIKFEGQWVNLAKYMIAQSSEIEVLPDFSDMPSFEANGGMSSSLFNLHTYNYENRTMYDIHGEITKEMDDRRRVQKAIFKQDFDEMKNWNVTIGDTTLFVPPTSIRLQTATTLERLPVIRSKGSITKGGQKVQKMLELTVYFNEERGINGYPFVDKLPNGTEVTYYMNGLRALIAQFKFTPFLPIENNYINMALNIDAVTLVNLQVTSNPSFPRLMKVVLTLQEFDYLQYMPELPLDLDKKESSYYNPFASTFNFELMRWYYQKPIQLGEKLRNLSINSTEYLEGIKGSKTALFPMKFEDSNFKIFVANEEHLKKMLQVKVMKTKNATKRTVPVISDNEEGFIKDMSRFYDAYMNLEGDKDVKSAINDLDDLSSGNKRVMLTLAEDAEAIGSPYYRGSETRVVKKDSYQTVNKDGAQNAINELSSVVASKLYSAQDSANDITVRLDSTYIKREGKKAILGVVVDMTSLFKNVDSIENITRIAEMQLGKELSEHIRNGKIVVEYEAKLKHVQLNQYVVDSDFTIRKGVEAEYIALLKSFNDRIERDGSATINDEIEGNDGIGDDTELMETLTYDEMELGDIRISNIACVYGNTFTQMGLNGTEGYASQYMGGQDSIVELSFETTSAYSVGMLNGLPKLASQLVTAYKLILPSAPIRFESDITRLFGIVEVAVESVDIATVPSQPGLYRVNMRLVSVDRTMREREGIEKVNEFAHGGLTSTEGVRDIKARTFADLNKRYGEAELYPDLELPTLKELEDAKFHFLRHSFDKTRTYPDPDFYYNYGHILQSQVFRESVIQTDLEEYDKTWEDTHGGKVKACAAKDVGYTETEKNDKAQKRDDAIDKAQGILQANSSKMMQDYIENKVPVLNVMDKFNSQEVWEIGEKVRVTLMEGAYTDLLNNRKALKDSSKEAKQSDWLAGKLEKVDDIVDMINDILAEPIEAIRVGDSTVASVIKTHAIRILKRKEYREIFEALGVNKKYSKFTAMFGSAIYAVAASKTGRMEYRKGLSEDDYGPDKDFIGFKVSDMQDGFGMQAIKDVTDVSQAVEFGMFRFKMYYPQQAKSILGDNILYNQDRKKDSQDINTQLVLLDPYYATSSLEEVAEYKRLCTENAAFAVEAFIRQSLLWLRRLIKDRLVPNVMMDLFREEFEKELKDVKDDAINSKMEPKTDAEKKLGQEGAEQLEQQIKSYLEFLEDSEEDVNNGKGFLLCALFCGENELYSLIKERKFAELNTLKLSLTSMSTDFSLVNSEHMYLRKFLLALIPAGVINGVEDLSSRFNDTIRDYRQAQLERKYIEFAEDPNVYVRHAFYDMCVHDMRGRMARAFPSFYMVLIDEGQEIGMYKLNDNFYNVNAVSEIQVHRSRKIPADTCRIVLSNLFHSFTTDDEDKTVEYVYNPMDIFNSVFRPGEIYGQEQEKRLRQQPLNRVKLTAGTRIHIRMGYGANAATLPVAFNGRITEINAGDIMELVAQGDGVELMQPIVEELDAEEMQNEDKFFSGLNNIITNADTPKAIIDGVLNTTSSWLREKAKELSNNYFKNPHKYGITNFGDTRENTIFKNGEVVQNIFEAISTPKWGDLEDGKQGSWNLKEAPKISTELMGKTVWDVLHFCASASPDFIIGVAPFGMRSTIFHGHPRYYYAFDYILDDTGQIAYEKRKPYQQYHIITSYSDIIQNNFKADSTRIKTNAVGTYKSTGWFFNDSIKQTDRLFVDWDIYPENQRSMIFDTQLRDKGSPVNIFGVGKGVQKGVNWFTELWTDDADTTGGVLQDYKKIARRMTANALKDSIKDMYAGDMVLLGTPSLKPHDRLIINDTYENMSGHVTVESVTHSLSADTGFTSTVIPDCISTVDDQFEKGSRSVADYVNVSAMTIYAGLLAGSLVADKGLGPLTQLSKFAGKMAIPNFARRFAEQRGLVSLTDPNVSARDARILARGADVVDRVVDKGGLAGKTLGKILAGSAGGVPGLVAMLGWTLVEIGATYTLGALTSKAVDKLLKNSQVLTIFPVKHNGKTMTSGLTGEIGSVYGSVNYERLGAIESIVKYLDTENNDLSTGWNTFIDFLVDDETQNIIRAHNLRIINSTEEAGTADIQIHEYLSDAAAGESSKIAGYKRLLVSPRLNINDQAGADSLGQIYERTAILDPRMLEAQRRITAEYTYLGNDTVLKNMANNDFLKIVWKETPSDVESEMVNFRGINAPVKVYKKERSDGEYMYDIPFLKDDAITVLKQIVSRASYLNPQYDDKNGLQSTITVTSALIVGEETASLSGVGYCFTLEADGENADYFLKEAIEGLYQYNTEQYENELSVNPVIFMRRELDERKFQISVLPPKA